MSLGFTEAFMLQIPEYLFVVTLVQKNYNK